jgi:hypothetical protein
MLDTCLIAKCLCDLAEDIRRPWHHALYHSAGRVVRGVLADKPDYTRSGLGVPNLIDTIREALDDRQRRRRWTRMSGALHLGLNEGF